MEPPPMRRRRMRRSRRRSWGERRLSKTCIGVMAAKKGASWSVASGRDEGQTARSESEPTSERTTIICPAMNFSGRQSRAVEPFGIRRKRSVASALRTIRCFSTLRRCGCPVLPEVCTLKEGSAFKNVWRKWAASRLNFLCSGVPHHMCSPSRQSGAPLKLVTKRLPVPSP